MRSKLIILGCGSSIGVPRIDGYWGNCDKNEKKNNNIILTIFWTNLSTAKKPWEIRMS